MQVKNKSRKELLLIGGQTAYQLCTGYYWPIVHQVGVLSYSERRCELNQFRL